MFARVRDLDAGQRRVLTAVAAIVGALALATGAVVLSDDDPGEATVQTDHDGTSTTHASSTTSSTAPTSTTVVDSSTTTAAVASAGTGGGVTTTTRRPAGGGGSATTRPPTTSPATSPPTTPATDPPQTGVCNTGGGTAGQMANKFCAHRANLGLPTMTRNAALDQMAQEWAAKMAADEALSHRPNAGAMVAARCDCPGWSENVAFDETVGEAWSEWLKSTMGHRENIEDPRDGEYGIGVASGGPYLWFVMVFGYY